MERNATVVHARTATTAAAASEYETFEDDLSEKRSQNQPQSRAGRTVPQKPPRNHPPLPKQPTKQGSKNLDLQYPPSPQKTALRLQSSLPSLQSSSNSSSVTQLPTASVPSVFLAARTSVNDDIISSLHSKTPSPVISPTPSLRIHPQRPRTVISRPSIPPPPPPPALVSSQSSVPNQPHNSSLGSTSFTSIHSTAPPSNSSSTPPSSHAKSNVHSTSNLQDSPSVPPLPCRPLDAACSVADTEASPNPTPQSQLPSTAVTVEDSRPMESPTSLLQPTDLKGCLMKLVDKKWKTRFFVLKSKFWALAYYQTMSDYQSKGAVVRGVYPLLGAQASGLVEVNQGFKFILTLRTSQMIQLKLSEKETIEHWRQSIQAAIQHPLPAFIGATKTGTTLLVHSRRSTPRSIKLNFMNQHLYLSKIGSPEALSGLALASANIIMAKGTKQGYDITIKKDYETTVLHFQSLEDWVSWGTALESCSS